MKTTQKSGILTRTFLNTSAITVNDLQISGQNLINSSQLKELLSDQVKLELSQFHFITAYNSCFLMLLLLLRVIPISSPETSYEKLVFHIIII